MEFISKLIDSMSKADKEKLNKFGIFSEENRYRGFRGIQIGPYILSIQGSYGHYCTPRTTIDPEDYSEMEMAVIKDKEFHSILDDDNFKDFPFKSEFEEREDSPGLYAYIKVELIEALYQFLKHKYEGVNA